MAKRKAAEESDKTSRFEDSLNELQSIVAELESGSLGLEMSLARFERGIGLLRDCYSSLESAERKVEILTSFDGKETPITQPFENAPTLATPTPEAVRDKHADSDGGNAAQSSAQPERSALF